MNGLKSLILELTKLDEPRMEIKEFRLTYKGIEGGKVTATIVAGVPNAFNLTLSLSLILGNLSTSLFKLNSTSEGVGVR